jgi:carboxylesterase type B
MKKYLLTLALSALSIAGFSQETLYETERNIPYYPESIRQSDNYISERCVLDIYYPTNKKDFATIVWFHGGGLTGG